MSPKLITPNGHEISAMRWDNPEETFDDTDKIYYDDSLASIANDFSNGEDWGLLEVESLNGPDMIVAPGDWIVEFPNTNKETIVLSDEAMHMLFFIPED